MSKSEIKIIGIGWAKTGTTTLGTCLKELGFKHQSQDLTLVKELKENDFGRFNRLLDEYDSFEDWPWLLYYEDIYSMYPNAKFILTVRDEESWVKSYKNMLKNQGKAHKSMNEIRNFLYGLDFPNVSEKDLIARYQKHNKDVKAFFQNKNKQLLVVNWIEGDGWNELCEFLDIEVPKVDFPHSNKGAYVDQKSNSFIRRLVRKIKR